MALNRYVLTATTTVPAGTPATVTAGEPGTGGAAGFGCVGISAGYAAFPQSFQPGTPIVLDNASPLYTVPERPGRGARLCARHRRREPRRDQQLRVP